MRIVVNEQEIADAEYRRELAQARRAMPQATDEQLESAVTRRVVDQTLLLQEANRRISTVSSKDVQEELNRLIERHGGEEAFYRRFGLKRENDSELRSQIRQNIKSQRMLDQLTSDVSEPTDDAVRDYYERNKDDYVTPEQVHAWHIVKPVTPATSAAVHRDMVAARRRLRDGADFAQVADEVSECRDDHGDLGFIERGRMVEEFEVVVFSLENGEISPVFKTAFGYHIAQVTEKRESHPMTYEEAAEEIRATLHQQAKSAAIARWLEGAREKANIEIAKQDSSSS